jgi:hypothetical protein
VKPATRVTAELAATLIGLTAATLSAPPANAGILCDYPGVGVGVGLFGIRGWFCDFPVEINGSHWHCEIGGASIGGVIGFSDNGVSGGIAGGGVGGASCSWRCPDGSMAPAPNPPGAWKEYLVPMNSTNYCKDHMTPNGFWSAPVLPTEGIPPAGEIAPQPGEILPPQPTPPPQPSAAPTVTPSLPPGPVPGEPNALQPAPGEPNP